MIGIQKCLAKKKASQIGNVPRSYWDWDKNIYTLKSQRINAGLSLGRISDSEQLDFF
jgi:hypothetical protein